MIKKIIAGIAVASTLVFTGIASAAANLTFLTVDGATNSTVQQGESVEAKVTFDVTSSTDVESMSWELVGSGLPQTCVNTVDRIADGTFTNSFDIDTDGATEGTWDVRIRSYGDDDADVSNLCETSDQNDSALFADRITVTDDIDDNQNNNNDNNNSGGSDNALDALTALVAQLAAQIQAILHPPTPPAPVVSPACSAYAQANAGTVQNVKNDANVRLQGFLLSQGASIPALAAGASFGFYGPQTMAAVGWFQSANHCN